MSSPPDDALHRRLSLHLALGLSLYSVCAVADAVLTLRGLQGDLDLEANPLMRWMMTTFGHTGGLVLEKSLVALFATALTVAVARGIHGRQEWVYRLALTPITRRWMRRERRYWIAWLPLYLSAAGQGVAALVWWWLIYCRPD